MNHKSSQSSAGTGALTDVATDNHANRNLSSTPRFSEVTLVNQSWSQPF
jgi:hypothetical protein